MSFLTPPPDFDECVDATSILTNNSRAIQDIFYPSPASTSIGHIRSGSYSPSCQPDSTFMEQQTSHPQLFADHHSSLRFDTTQDSNMYAVEAPFNLYEQTTWSSYPGLTVHYPPLQTGHGESPFYESHPQPESSLSGMLPPTPQPVTPNGYSFGALMKRSDSSAFFGALHPRQAFTPEASISASVSNPSRSCSPNPPSFSAGVSSRSIQRRPREHPAQIASASSPLSHYGVPVHTSGSSATSAPQAWRCAYPNCTSRATFIRGCDLRKHYNRHSKHLFCRVVGCPQSEAAAVAAAQMQDPTCTNPSQLMLSGGFSSKKDRARHEAKHNPGIKCEWRGPDGEECGRLFSRMDNMKDHVRRIHNKGQTPSSAGSTPLAERNRRGKRNSR